MPLTKAEWIEVVAESVKKTAIFRFAITNAEANNPTMKAVSTVVPFGIAASAATEAITDKHSFAGEIQAKARGVVNQRRTEFGSR